tara:strand:- start:1164 stop:1607 length:444 start_codon:yes stop_codon:yes gene_type:complete
MSLTLAQARDAVGLLINTAWLAAPAAAGISMRWDNVKADKPGEDGTTTNAEPFARTTIRVIESPQITQGRRRYQTEGSVTVQIFTPFGDGHTVGDALVQVILDTLRGHAGGTDGLWFFDINPNELGTEGPWFMTIVGATFRFQELAP